MIDLDGIKRRADAGYYGVPSDSAQCIKSDASALLAEVERLRAALAAERENVEKVTATKDAAYHERDQVVAALASLAANVGWPVWLATHVGPWEDDWRNIVFIGTPHGQVSWHYHDSERDLFSMHKSDQSILWDGHSTAEKYERLSHLGDSARRAAEAQAGRVGDPYYERVTTPADATKWPRRAAKVKGPT